MSNIDLLISNLENTIKGKSILLKHCYDHPILAQFIEINLEELGKILLDAKKVKEDILQLEADLDGFVHGSS
jgi:hypothetical protein